METQIIRSKANEGLKKKRSKVRPFQVGRRTSVNQCSDVGICLIQLVEPLLRAAQLQKSEGGEQ